MPEVGNLVHETSVTSGTGNLTVVAVNGKRTFNTEFSTGGTDVFDYFVSNPAATEWERGTGHMSTSTVLVRDTVIQSSNGDAAVSFSADRKDITNDVPASNQNRNSKAIVSLLIYNDETDTIIENGAGAVIWRVPSSLNGMDLIEVAAMVGTAGTTGNLDIQIRNVTQAADMLTTVMRIETTETDTLTSAQPGTIDTANDDVATGNKLQVDIDAVQTGTAALGLVVELTFQLP